MKKKEIATIAVVVAAAIAIAAFIMLSGRPGRPFMNPDRTFNETMDPNWTINETLMDEVSGIFDAGSSEEISAYCQGNPMACAQYCRENPGNELCSGLDIGPRRY